MTPPARRVRNLFRPLLPAALLALGAGLAARAAPEPPSDPLPYRTDSVLVAFKPRVPGEARLASVRRLSLQVADADAHFARLRVSSEARAGGATVPAVLAALRRDPTVRLAEPDYRIEAFAIPDDPKFSQQYALSNTGQGGGLFHADVDAPRAWDFAAGTAGIVAVIDTGIDYDHEDLKSNVYRDGFGQIVGYDFLNNDPDPRDDHGHGTHVAGVLGARGNNRVGISGICQQVRLMPLKILGRGGGGGSIGDAVRAIDFAIQNGAQVINASWGQEEPSQFLLEAIQRARDAGILFVAAAGNLGRDNDEVPIYPASYSLVCSNVVSVASSDNRDTLAPDSNYGAASVDVAAPGDAILSTLPGNSYGAYSGTSFAAPLVAGVAALIRSRFPLLKLEDWKARLLASVDYPAGLAGKVATGRLDAGKAVENDALAPAAPLGLQATHVGEGTLRLAWFAGGDDGMEGQAARYELRYATQPITMDTFSAALEATDLPDPQASGTRQSCLLTGLSGGQDYYLALRAFDNAGNVSAVASVGPVHTLAATGTWALQDGGEAAPFFTGSGGWAQSGEDHATGSRCYTDSPGAVTRGIRDTALTQTAEVTPGGPVPLLAFAARTELEPGLDRLDVEVMAGGGTWTPVLTLRGRTPWTPYRVPLPAYRDRALRVRFHLVGDPYGERDGAWIDDIRLGGTESLALLLEDTAEGTPKFTGAGAWDVASERSFSPSLAYSDSPGALYANSRDLSLTQNASVSLSSAVPLLNFWAETNLEDGLDFLHVEVASGASSSWRRVLSLSGTHPGRFHTVPLARELGLPVRVRFRLVTSAEGRGDGAWIDDVRLLGEVLRPALPPAPPKDLTATAVSESEARLRWTDASTDEVGFEIERTAAGEKSPRLLIAAANTGAFLDVGLSPQTTYSYRIRAYSDAGNSAYTRLVSATTLSEPRGKIAVPQQVDFGTVRVGRTGSKQITVRNASGSTGLRISSSAPPPPFTIDGPGASTYIAAGKSLTLRLRFRPTRKGRVTGSLVLTTTDPTHRAVTVKLKGVGG